MNHPRPPERGRNSPWVIVLAVVGLLAIGALVAQRWQDNKNSREIRDGVEQLGD